MNRYNLFDYEVEIDGVATKEWYANAHGWDCPCEDCKYFISLARKRELPVIILDTLSRFDIPPEKATYVCSITEENNEVLYEISYRVVGNILKEKECDINDSGRGEAYCGHNPYPYGAPGFPDPHFDLEFWVWLPMLHSVAEL